ncbi:MAG: hypothetical protein NVSMB6_33070 [Burkholderiaceae bacterium]
MGQASTAALSYSQAANALSSVRLAANQQANVDYRTRNILGLRRDAYNLRVALYNFDQQIRGITFPDSARTDVNALLEADRQYTTGLDALSAAPTLAQYLQAVGPSRQGRDLFRAADARVKQDLNIR